MDFALHFYNNFLALQREPCFKFKNFSNRGHEQFRTLLYAFHADSNFYELVEGGDFSFKIALYFYIVIPARAIVRNGRVRA